MSFRRIFLSLVTVWLGIMGVAFGTLCLICAIIFLLWYGLSTSMVVFGVLCLSCLGMAGLLSRCAVGKEKSSLLSRERIEISEGDNYSFPKSASSGSRSREARQHKIL